MRRHARGDDPVSSESIKLLGESSIGSGVRRVEALVGADAYQFLAREHVLVAQLTDALKVRPEELPERVDDIVERLRAAEKEIDRVRVVALLSRAGELAACRARRLRRSVRRLTSPRARARATYAGSRSTSVVGCAATCPAVVTIVGTGRRQARPWSSRSTTPRASWRLAAGDLVKVAASTLGGSGGGKDDVAQGGGTDPPGGPTALQDVERAIAERVTSWLTHTRRADRSVRTGVRLGVDVGDVRIGVARCDRGRADRHSGRDGRARSR